MTKFFQSTAIALCLAALYGIINHLPLGWHLPGASAVVSVRPQVALPLLAGFLMGPWAGFVVGAAGNLLGDWLSGWGIQYWPFSLGNGLMGAVLGILPRVGIPRIGNAAQFAWLTLTLAGSHVLCIGSGLIIYNMLVVDSLQNLTWIFFHPIVVSNILMSFLLVPPALLLAGRMSDTFDLRMSVSLFYLLIAVIIPLLLGVKALDHHILRGELATLIPPAATGQLLERIALSDFRLGGTIGIAALLASLALVFVLIQYVAHPVRALLRATNLLRDGRLDEINLAELTRKDDEFGRLARVFAEAVTQVQTRERGLRDAIRQLQVEIDRDQTARHASEITETDYFRALREKSVELRARKQATTP